MCVDHVFAQVIPLWVDVDVDVGQLPGERHMRLGGNTPYHGLSRTRRTLCMTMMSAARRNVTQKHRITVLAMGSWLLAMKRLLLSSALSTARPMMPAIPMITAIALASTNICGAQG